MNPTSNPNNPPFPAISSSLQQRDTTISTATKEITQLTCQLMENLNRRSTALANGANFDLALRDAAVMRVIIPTSSLGYLKAGNIYQQRGQHKEAVSMYEEGLLNVPSGDQCYTNLEKGHADAANAAYNSIDFISQLPLDIVESKILPLVFHDYKLEADTPCPYLYVSRTWRQRIQQCNNLSFHINRLPIDQPFQFRELERFSAHVKTLSMAAGRQVTFSAFNGCDFSNLTSLSMISHGSEEADIIHALESVQPTLTHLVLYTVNENTPRIHLRGVLELCPNLVSLKLTTLTLHPLSVQYPKLTHLTLSADIVTNSHEMVINILSHLPSLVYLDIFYVPDSQFLTSVCQYCPNMKLLKCGPSHVFNEDNDDRDVDGLQKLFFGYHDVYRMHNADALIRLLHDNHQSLNHVVLTGKVFAAESITLDEKSWDASLNFNCLEEFEVDALNDQLALLAMSIIRRSPHLHRVTIGNHTANQHYISNAVKGLTSLQMLSAIQLTRASQWLSNILEHHVQLGKDSTLKELKIDMDYNDESTFNWMHAIGGLKTLQRLVISTPAIDAPSDYVSAMATIKGCPSLSYLDLYYGRYPAPAETIALLKRHPTLQCLHIRASSIADRDIINLVSFPNLQHIIINAGVDHSLIRLLQEHIQKVEHRLP
ncbi:hypothetical protein O0I10_006281 [Lichtheimia ornata]|uniref:Uncharacterized protein n=1 Tax=Lichtheimia ornata TaxID=688661 RepID=A0AAD7XXD1_9FUNG|nr:uncharacterized protein O0I10_006281 [Lichtheimia ornata]KAJ8658010.1 hypothetical protein O0I10_006281 [Lichtheimia ornata]